MRRLYSTFAGGRPGIGLLGLRLVIGVVLLARLGGTPAVAALPLTFASGTLAASALLLVIGLWTPVAGAVAATIEIVQVARLDEHPWVGLLAATIAIALTMLGPGRWSFDARLFGWKRIDTPIHRK